MNCGVSLVHPALKQLLDEEVLAAVQVVIVRPVSKRDRLPPWFQGIAWVMFCNLRDHMSIGAQARGVARTRNCYMLAIQQLAGINRMEDAAECAPIAC